MNQLFLIQLIHKCLPVDAVEEGMFDSAIKLDGRLDDSRISDEFEWLTAKGYALPDEDGGSDQRGKLPLIGRKLERRTAHASVLLTPAGVALTRYLLEYESAIRHSVPHSKKLDVAADTVPTSALCFHPELTPHWDNRTYDLWAGPILVRSFSRNAPNQMAVLDAFQEQRWPRRIENPLSCDSYDMDPQQQLHDTIKCLNSGMALELIRFRGDGTGTGVLWEWRPPVKSGDARRSRDRCGERKNRKKTNFPKLP